VAGLRNGAVLVHVRDGIGVLIPDRARPHPFVVRVRIHANAGETVRVGGPASVAAAGRAGRRRYARIALLEAHRVVHRAAALRAGGAAAETGVADAGHAIAVLLAMQSGEERVDAVGVEVRAGLAVAGRRAGLVRGRHQVGAEVPVGVGDDWVFI